MNTLDWPALTDELDNSGHAQTRTPVLDPETCREIAGLFDRPELFRATIDMSRHRFGQGTYRYFAHPLPEKVVELRRSFYEHLLPVARDWEEKLRRPGDWPDDFDAWLDRCHEHGQTRPTPILLRYGAGDWNALHRDLYGDLVFPLQVVIGLDRPGEDYEGGEFMMVEQRPRAQSRGYSATLEQGHATIFTTRERPVRSTRGWSAGPVRHGVSTIRRGTRHTLGLVLHDAT